MIGSSIVICTNNLVPRTLFKEILERNISLASQVDNSEIIIVSHYPVCLEYVTYNFVNGPDLKYHKEFEDVLIKNFKIQNSILDHVQYNVPIKNIVVGEREYNCNTILEQMRLAYHFCNYDKIIVMEHDIIYPQEYVKKVSRILDSGVDICYWKSTCYLSKDGYFKLDTCSLSSFSFNKKSYINWLTNKDEKSFEPILYGYGNFSEYSFMFNNYAIVNSDDILDIKHGANTSGQIIPCEYFDEHPVLGKKEKYINLIDKEYSDIINQNKICSYGLTY